MRLFQFSELALVIQMKGAIHHNALIDRKPFQHWTHVGHFRTQLDGNTQKPIIALRQEDIVAIGLTHHCGFRHYQAFMRVIRNMHGGQHVGLELALGFSTIVRTITVRVNGFTVSATKMISPSKVYIAKCWYVDFHMLTDPHIARYLLRHIAHHPDGGKVGHLE